jgi:hypothetical protein
MSSKSGAYITTRYAPSLSRHDVSTIVDWFKSDLGSKEAQAKLGIAYKTMFDCKKPGSHSRDTTKQKILSKAWEDYPYQTLDLLLNKVVQNFVDLYQYYVSYVYEQAIVDEPDTFPLSLKRLEMVMSKLEDLYTALDMSNNTLIINNVNLKAKELGVPEIQRRLEQMSPLEVAEKFNNSIRQMKQTQDSIAKIALDNDLPVDAMEQLSLASGRIEGSPPPFNGEYPSLRLEQRAPLGSFVFSKDGSRDG